MAKHKYKVNNNTYHLEATLTINRTFPLNLLRGTSFLSISCTT